MKNGKKSDILVPEVMGEIDKARVNPITQFLKNSLVRISVKTLTYGLLLIILTGIGIILYNSYVLRNTSEKEFAFTDALVIYVEGNSKEAEKNYAKNVLLSINNYHSKYSLEYDVSQDIVLKTGKGDEYFGHIEGNQIIRVAPNSTVEKWLSFTLPNGEVVESVQFISRVKDSIVMPNLSVYIPCDGQFCTVNVQASPTPTNSSANSFAEQETLGIRAALDSFLSGNNKQSYVSKETGLTFYLPKTLSSIEYVTSGISEYGPAEEDCYKLTNENTISDTQLFCQSVHVEYSLATASKLMIFSDYFDMYHGSYPENLSSMLEKDTVATNVEVTIFGKQVVLKKLVSTNYKVVFGVIKAPNGSLYTVMWTLKDFPMVEDKDYELLMFTQILKNIKIQE